ncbi:MAG: DEAD/DEAH box helicase [Candidatus Methanomethylophilaceae archaeon]|nr:DEAD/DEAH box helicase [Candidatus Methanomethylophilaceae archaeon]
MTDRFDSLPWFLREYIHANRWESFRSVQEKAFDILFGTDRHLLISSETSSGKTEAALFPAISSIYSNPPRSVGALYVGPLKALIDDQFERLEPMLKDSYIEVTGWHGDISLQSKAKLLEVPSGILQITPESLQNIVASRPEDLERLFGDLRFVIIDEVHAFMGSDRGQQLLCCLERLDMLAHCEPRRIGLSATIADTGSVAEWLSANTGRETAVVTDRPTAKRDLIIYYSRFPSPAEDPNPRKKSVNSFYKLLYKEIRGRNCIVFTNSRVTAERTARSLKKMAEDAKDPDVIHVHHGSISKELRKSAEENLKDPSKKTVTVSTVTLELGIDVGSLDAVIQIDTPYTCSSFVQRMGRSGRRGGAQIMRMFCREDQEKWWSSVEGVSMDLIKGIAIATLAEEGWTESESEPSLPYGLLFHQTMECMRHGTGTKFSRLLSDVLPMYPFRNIKKEEYAELVRYMISVGIIMKMDDGTLLITDKGEKISSDRDFCSVFTVKKEIEVSCDGKGVGTIQEMPKQGDLIQLAGRIWKVVEINGKSRSVEVEETEGSADTLWKSGVPETDNRIMERMREILSSDEGYGFLDASASEELSASRRMAIQSEMLKGIVETDYGYRIYPWIGTRAFDTLCRVLRMVCDKVLERPPYFADVMTELDWGELLEYIERYSDKRFAADLIGDDRLEFGKYDRYVPEDLLMKSLAEDKLDFSYLDVLRDF